MIGEHLFSFSDFNIDPLSGGARDRLYAEVHAKRKAMKESPASRRKEILVGGTVWSRGYDFYFEVYPTDLTEDAVDQPTPL